MHAAPVPPNTPTTASPTITTLKPNPIDALLAAARMMAAHGRELLVLSFLLETVKVLLMLALVDVLGYRLGSNVGVAIIAVIVVVSQALGTQLALDVRAGRPPQGIAELIDRTVPMFPRYLAAAAILWVTIRLLPQVSLAFLLPAMAALWLLMLAPPATTREATIGDALRTSLRLTSWAPAAAFGLFVFSFFSWELVDALTDSLVGRKAPLELWLTVRGALQVAELPLVSMTIALLYLDLDAAAPRLDQPATFTRGPGQQPPGAWVPTGPGAGGAAHQPGGLPGITPPHQPGGLPGITPPGQPFPEYPKAPPTD